ncbi:metallophosphoesterase [Galbitalea sp. SE-J8]|uniref:metallophosphoesterase n=1 Tax=Galbitalea sp. SE-J8 TaxID=3054952 RepID=UPI00259CE169|nr:metallophosphoesterase [Galbitalea sp. SE-J8]MDM4762895.1 metallophosphoesterase [Galbitalea sp. SE-J8]
MLLGQYGAPTHTIAHLSDPHLLAGGAPLHGAVDTVAHLERAVTMLRHLDPLPQALVFTGDLADLGEPDAYRRLRSIVEPAAAAIGAEVIWVMGNHDEREPYAAELFGEQPTSAPQDRVHDLDGLRIVSLDTTVRGYHHGALDSSQLDWLRGVLATPAPHGTVIAVHHPPVPVPLMPAMAMLELFDQGALADVVRGTDVRAILGGHLHYSTHSTFAGIPVSVAAATCYTMALATPDRLISGVDANQAISMVHVYDDRIVHTAVPLVDQPETSSFPASARSRIEAMTPEERTEAFSRKDSTFNRGAE